MVFGWLIGALLFVVPLWFLLPRAGIPAAISLAAFIPLGAIILLWILAFKRWPTEDISERF